MFTQDIFKLAIPLSVKFRTITSNEKNGKKVLFQKWELSRNDQLDARIDCIASLNGLIKAIKRFD